MRNARIWVVIMDGLSARICSSGDAAAIPITPPTEIRCGAIDEPRTKRLSEAWYFLGRRHGCLGGASSQFIQHVAQILGEAAAEHAFEGLVIVAAPEIAGQIERALSPGTRALMIGDIVRDLPTLAPGPQAAPSELRH